MHIGRIGPPPIRKVSSSAAHTMQLRAGLLDSYPSVILVGQLGKPHVEAS